MRYSRGFWIAVCLALCTAGLLRFAVLPQLAAVQSMPPLAMPEDEPGIYFHPTPPAVVERMLELAHIRKDDVLYDLGCGDGRIPIAAAKRYGIRAVGIDIDPECVAAARRHVHDAGVEQFVEIREGNIYKESFDDATVVTLYLLPEMNARLAPQLQKLPPGTRIVTHDFTIDGYLPDRTVTMPPQNDDWHADHRLHVYTIPLNPDSRGIAGGSENGGGSS